MEAHAGEYIRNYLHVKSCSRISLVCKLVPVQYREYKYGLFEKLHTWGGGERSWEELC